MKVRAADDFKFIRTRQNEINEAKRVIRETPAQDAVAYDIRYCLRPGGFLNARALSDRAKAYFVTRPSYIGNDVISTADVSLHSMEAWIKQQGWIAQRVDANNEV